MNKSSFYKARFTITVCSTLQYVLFYSIENAGFNLINWFYDCCLKNSAIEIPFCDGCCFSLQHQLPSTTSHPNFLLVLSTSCFLQQPPLPQILFSSPIPFHRFLYCRSQKKLDGMELVTKIFSTSSSGPWTLPYHDTYHILYYNSFAICLPHQTLEEAQTKHLFHSCL